MKFYNPETFSDYQDTDFEDDGLSMKSETESVSCVEEDSISVSENTIQQTSNETANNWRLPGFMSLQEEEYKHPY